MRSEGRRGGSSAMMRLVSLLCYLCTVWMIFYDDPGWTTEPCYTKAAKAPSAPAPNTLRVMCSCPRHESTYVHTSGEPIGVRTAI